MVRPAKFNKQVTIQVRTMDEKEQGGWLDDWADWFTVKAKVTPLPRTARMDYGKQGYVETYDLEMRARKTQNIEPHRCRVVYNGGYFAIQELRVEDYYVFCVIAR
jgi:SPP1 family predicted phage head-tail adaptor